MRTYIGKKLQVQEIEDVQSRCRLCLGKTEDMVAIFDANVDDIFSGLSMRIGMCLGLEVSREDLFPKFICQPCNTDLDKFYNFKKSCAATYRKLKATLTVNQEKNTNKLISNKPNESNANVVSDPSQNLEENDLLIDIPNKSQLKEASVRQENEILHEVDAENSTCEREIGGVKEGCQIPLSDELSELIVEVDDNQWCQGNKILEPVEIQNEETKDKTSSKSVHGLPAYIITSLIDKGVLARQGDALEILDPSTQTFTLEAACGSEITMELVEEDPSMPADECNKTAQPSNDLKKDARTCGTCGARFPSRCALARHARVHSGERPFACACGRRFAQREVLRRHQLLHEDQLPYQCPQCPKAYTQRGALLAHARAHAPAPRPLVLHRCTRCPKLFLYPSGLSRHMNVHQGRDYPCDECPRTFTDKSSLQRHRRAHLKRAR